MNPDIYHLYEDKFIFQVDGTACKTRTLELSGATQAATFDTELSDHWTGLSSEIVQDTKVDRS